MDERVGELYALGTAVCWVGTALFFAAAGRRVGSLAVNFIRLVMALGFLVSLQALRGAPLLPFDASSHAWRWLSLSGIVGFAFGDLCLFRAFVVLGPRLSTLLMATAPLFAALFGWLLLGELLTVTDAAGMSLTIGGVAWAITDRQPEGAPTDGEGPRWIGVLLALGGAVGQGGGLVLSKYGMGDFDAFGANQIRVVAGLVGFAAIFTVTRWWPKVVGALRHRAAMAYTGGGAVLGPFLGVSLSLLAVQHTGTGVAASIMAISPVLIIPAVVLLGRERVGVGGIGGAVVAVSGLILLFR